MASLRSDYFGEVIFDSADVFHFPEGLPGFEDEKHFTPVQVPGQQPLLYLQSLQRPDLCILTLPARFLLPDYRLTLAARDHTLLGLAEDAFPTIGPELECLVILAVEPDRLPTANLLAPIVINKEKRLAMQSVQYESGYSCEQPVVGTGPC